MAASTDHGLQPLAPGKSFLSSKERETIRMVADGASPRVIAQRLEFREIEVRASLDSTLKNWRSPVGWNSCPGKCLKESHSKARLLTVVYQLNAGFWRHLKYQIGDR